MINKRKPLTPLPTMGHRKRSLKQTLAKFLFEVPLDLEASFDPVLVPKRSQYSTGVENLIISLYSKGMSLSDIHL
jgi:transposase-like protein